MKIVVFGTGNMFKKYINHIKINNYIVSILDNNIEKQGSYMENVQVVLPDSITGIEYDFVILMSDYAVEMRKQLIELGVPKHKIIHYREYIHMFPVGLCAPETSKLQKKILIITSPVGYHGGSIVAIYLAQAFNQKGFFVTIAAPEIDSRVKEEFSNDKLEFQECPHIQFSKEFDWDVINKYEFVFVNTFPMIMCALEISRHKKVMLWLHESDIEYRRLEYWREEIINECQTNNLSIYAVSDLAKKCFENNLCKKDIKVFPYAIADSYGEFRNEHSGLSFAVVGTIYPLKQQLLFLDAIDLIKDENRTQCKFYIVGKNGDDEYFEEVQKRALEIENVKIVEELTRQELLKFYQKVDVMVIPSQQEAMSLIATEAMMLGKVCIITSNAGMAAYIHNRENGIVLRRCDRIDIAEAMEFCMDNRDVLAQIGRNARKTYLENFSLNIMKKNIDYLCRQLGE